MANPQMMALGQAQMRVVIGCHRDLVPSSIGFLPGGGRALRCHERVLAIMRAGGLPDSWSVAGLYLLWVIVNGFLLEETRTGYPERSRPDLSSEVRRYFASLPGDRFPNLVAVADEFANTDWDERFDLLIRTFIDGLTAQARLS